jgi:putative ABC transport system permease protein
MTLPLRYNVRSVLVRWRATLATILGVALVVAVYVMVQSLAVGLEKASGNTGDPRNLMVVRRGAVAESGSQITREQFNLVQYQPEIARDDNGRALISADTVIVINLPRGPGMEGEANVTLRGVSRNGFALRPQVALTSGRWFTPGRREVVVSRRLAARFANMGLGGTLRIGARELTVTGQFDAGGSAFDSEAWMDADEVRSFFNRDNYSSLLLRPRDDVAAETLRQKLEGDKRLTVRALAEVAYYKEQTRTAMPIRVLGNFLATAMSIGAVFAAMNTMYASVGARTREIGTLRVLGFRRRTVLAGFLIEGALLAAVGGVIGCLFSLPMNGYSTGTVGFESFSETIFEFRITPWLAAKGMLFAVSVGLLGSLLPALRASRLPVITALKSV